MGISWRDAERNFCIWAAAKSGLSSGNTVFGGTFPEPSLEGICVSLPRGKSASQNEVNEGTARMVLRFRERETLMTQFSLLAAALQNSVPQGFFPTAGCGITVQFCENEDPEVPRFQAELTFSAAFI